MEEWKRDFEWLRIRHQVKEDLKRETLPDLNAVLFMIGIQELGRWQNSFTKEEKQDLMHIAVCSLLSGKGYFEFLGRDADGWPHFKPVKILAKMDLNEQENLLIESIIEYFKIRENEMV